uniref:PspC domain-containing protein n=1 Tax=Flavobacterium sp. TaxID=239 RepID=UPI002624B5D9
NKTVNINIGGLFFHIDEDAYQKLSRYFDAIKRSLSNSSGKDEIMKDIEMRVAELFTERQKSDKHVINNVDVDQVVAVMGQPEDYRIDDDAETPKSESFYIPNKTKKLYRDKDRGLIAGVCTGLSYYTGVEAVWIKVIFIILTLATAGWFLIVYLILWIATPKAITTSEKLEMTGEPVTISNIEKKVREEFENVSDKIKNADYDKMGNQLKSTAESAGSKLSAAFTSVFGAFAKVLGALLVVFSSIVLAVVAVVSIVMIFSSSMPDNKIVEFIKTPIGLETPIWAQGILFFFAAGIPLFFLLILGLKLLVTNLKSIGNIAKYSLLAIWIIAIGILISLGISEANQLAYSGKALEKQNMTIAATDTLKVRFAYNDFYSKRIDERSDYRLVQDSLGNEVIHSTNVTIHLKKTDKAFPYVQIEKLAQGKSFAEANQRAQKIKYSYKIIGNEIILDNYFTTEIKNKFRGQMVEVYLYLPEGIVYYPNENVEDYLSGNNADFDYYYGPEGYKYKVKGTELDCLNCPNEDGDVEINGTFDIEGDENSSTEGNDTIKSVSVKVNGKEVIQTTTGKGDEGSLTINKDGIIIKTK